MPLEGSQIPAGALTALDGYLVYPQPLRGLSEALRLSRFLQEKLKEG